MQFECCDIFSYLSLNMWMKEGYLELIQNHHISPHRNPFPRFLSIETRIDSYIVPFIECLFGIYCIIVYLSKPVKNIFNYLWATESAQTISHLKLIFRTFSKKIYIIHKQNEQNRIKNNAQKKSFTLDNQLLHLLVYLYVY